MPGNVSAMPAAGRVVEVDVNRLTGWVERFAERHGALSAELVDTGDGRQALVYHAPDGARASITVPYGRLPAVLDPDLDPSSTTRVASTVDPGAEALLLRVLDHLAAPRSIAILLVRRGGWAAGVADNGRVLAADIGGGYVQGRSKAGGWSQQRYARRRGHQSERVYERAADGAAAVLSPYRDRLDALLTGGDRAGVRAVLNDPRLTHLTPLVEPRFFSVADPQRSVLDDVVRRLDTVVVTLNELA